MSQQPDPPRLSQTGAPELAELLPGLQQARELGPSGEQLARMRAAVAQRVHEPSDAAQRDPAPNEATGDGGAAAGSPGALGTSAGAMKLIKLLAVSVLLGGAVYVGLRAAPGRVPAERTDVGGRAPAAAPATAHEHAPAPEYGQEQEQEQEQEHATSVPADRAKPRRRRSAAEANVPAADPRAELALLKRARASVRSDPARALALTAEHTAGFAAGTFAEEREVIAIEALLVQGSAAAAQARARAFFAAYPGSAHARRVRSLLVEHGVTPSGAADR